MSRSRESVAATRSLQVLDPATQGARVRGWAPMKTSDEVSADKLRGGFYSPDALVDVCLDRVLELLNGRGDATLLEPSAGDGGFLRGLARHQVGRQVREVTAVELLAGEAQKAESVLRASGLAGSVAAASVLDPAVLAVRHDIAVGNPPFVRFQFLTGSDRGHIDALGDRMGVSFAGVGNLWIPVFLTALNNLHNGGVFAFIVPAECFTGLAGRAVRTWLSSHAVQMRVDLFPPRSFPGVLQEVVVLSGQVTRGAAHGVKVHVHDHALGDSWRHVLDDGVGTWTGLLLLPEHIDAVKMAQAVPGVHSLGAVAKLSVATVTGANDYFCVTDEIRQRYDLDAWARPLLDRVRHAEGLDYTTADQETNINAGRPGWLLDSSLSSVVSAGAAAYIREGEQSDLDVRYKTRIRTPWWKVPVVKPGSLMLSKRSNQYPRLIKNSAGVVTTDTVYQGSPLQAFAGREQDIVTCFHNSLTLVTAEMNGRSFGGGVLELVPSEISSLALPLAETTPDHFKGLDALVRTGGANTDLLINETDALLTRQLRLDPDVWRLVAEARRALRDRRLARTPASKARPIASEA